MVAESGQIGHEDMKWISLNHIMKGGRDRADSVNSLNGSKWIHFTSVR